jgi:hypothetical protein
VRQHVSGPNVYNCARYVQCLQLERGVSSAVGRGRPDYDQQHCYHHTAVVKLEAAIAIELLMMGVRKSETC